MAKQSFLELYREYKKADEKAKEYADQAKILKDKLTSMIPPNETKGGVFHRQTTSRSISYAKALKDIKGLIPKTRLPEVDVIIDENTTEYTRSQLVEATK